MGHACGLISRARRTPFDLLHDESHDLVVLAEVAQEAGSNTFVLEKLVRLSLVLHGFEGYLPVGPGFGDASTIARAG